MNSITQYQQYVRDNPKTISSMEEGLRMASLMLPTSKFGDKAELVTEMSYAVLGLLGLYHDKVIANQFGELERNVPDLVRTLLGILTNTELVLEMGTRHMAGHARRWQVIQAIEVAKAVMRLYLLMQMRQGKMLENGGVLDSKVVRQNPALENEPSATEVSQEQNEWTGRRSGRQWKLTDSSQKYARKADTIANQNVDVESDALLGLVGEVLHIVRPVLFVILTRTRRDRKSWSPWVISLIVDLISARCSALAASTKSVPSDSEQNNIQDALNRFFSGSTSEGKPPKDVKRELTRRRMLFAYYLMRNPVFDIFTAKVVQKVFSPLEKISFLKSMASMPYETLKYYHENHFYSSAS